MNQTFAIIIGSYSPAASPKTKTFDESSTAKNKFKKFTNVFASFSENRKGNSGGGASWGNKFQRRWAITEKYTITKLSTGPGRNRSASLDHRHLVMLIAEQDHIGVDDHNGVGLVP